MGVKAVKYRLRWNSILQVVQAFSALSMVFKIISMLLVLDVSNFLGLVVHARISMFGGVEVRIPGFGNLALTLKELRKISQ